MGESSVGSIGEICAGILMGLCLLGSGLTWIWLWGRWGQGIPLLSYQPGRRPRPSDLAALLVFLFFHWGFLLEVALRLSDFGRGKGRYCVAELPTSADNLQTQAAGTTKRGRTRRSPSPSGVSANEGGPKGADLAAVFCRRRGTGPAG